MDYQVSARKWRPQTFEEVVGQVHVARTLTNAIRQGRVAHAYLFSGMRGVGKTTMARILAKSLNCEAIASGPTVAPCQTCPSCRSITAGQSPDVMEIDGASNRGIDEVRELREVVKYAPMGGKRRIYIIDEVHMLTKEAFNALLKTLEEPPAHVVFIFATTEDHKIPSTILSRCQLFRFKRITRQEIIAHLERIVREEGIRITGRGLGLIAKAADGSLRDALSFLDQAVAYSGKEVGDQDLLVLLGAAGRELLLSMVRAILDRKAAAALRWVKELADQGLDHRQFASELLEYFRHLVIAKASETPEELIDLSSDDVDEIRRLSTSADLEELQRLFGVFSAAMESFRGAVHPGFVLELAVIRATQIQPLESFERLLGRLDLLERSMEEGPPKDSVGFKTAPDASAPLGNRTTAPASDIPDKKAGLSSGEAGSSPDSGSGDAAAAVPDQPGPPIGKADEPVRELSSGKRVVPDAWNQGLKRLLQERPNLGSYLEKAVFQEWIRGDQNDVVVIGYDAGSAVFSDFIQKEDNRRLIASTLREVFQKPVELKVIRMERAAGEQQQLKLKKDQQEQQHRKRVKEETLSHPLVKEALNILGGEVIDIKEA